MIVCWFTYCCFEGVNINLLERLLTGLALVVAIALYMAPPLMTDENALFQMSGEPWMPQLEFRGWD